MNWGNSPAMILGAAVRASGTYVPLARTGLPCALAPDRPGSPAGGQDDGGCGGEHGRTGELHHQ